MSYTKVTAMGSEEIRVLPLRVLIFGKPLWNGDYTFRDAVYLKNGVANRPSFDDFYRRINGIPRTNNHKLPEV